MVARPGLLVDERAQTRLGRGNTRLEQPQTERMKIGAIVTVIEIEKGAHAPSREANSAAILLQPAASLGVNQIDPRLVDLLDRNRRLARLYLACQIRVQFVER